MEHTDPKVMNDPSAIQEKPPAHQPFNSQNVKKVAQNPSIRVATIGNVDSGKSTLCGLLSKGIADDGNGKTRAAVFNYGHEKGTGRTSSIAHEIMGWDEKGHQQFASHFTDNKQKYWTEVISKSNKFLNLLDLCGHEKYLKTTMTGLVGLIPDYSMLIVGANLGLSKMTKEHMGISLTIKLPFFVVVTKIDMVDKAVREKTVEDLKRLLRHPSCNKTPFLVSNKQEALMAADAVQNGSVCPIIPVSSVTLENIDLLTLFLYSLKSRNEVNPQIGSLDEAPQVNIHETFNIKGVGLAVAGTLRCGILKVGQNMLCGPDKLGKFRTVNISSIHVNRIPEEEANAGEYVCCVIKATNKKNVLTRQDIRKGMCLIDPSIDSSPSWEFEAYIEVLQMTACIKKGYQAFMHCGTIRQNVTFLSLDKEVIMAKESGTCRLRFMFSPEFISVDQPILLREGRTKVIGRITRVYRLSEQPDQSIPQTPALVPQDKTIEED
jgi:GTPase